MTIKAQGKCPSLLPMITKVILFVIFGSTEASICVDYEEITSDSSDVASDIL
jgi:hypothetical protein